MKISGFGRLHRIKKNSAVILLILVFFFSFSLPTALAASGDVLPTAGVLVIRAVLGAVLGAWLAALADR